MVNFMCQLIPVARYLVKHILAVSTKVFLDLALKSVDLE